MIMRGEGVAILSKHIRKTLPVSGVAGLVDMSDRGDKFFCQKYFPSIFSSQISGSQNLVRMLSASSQAKICFKFVWTLTSRGHVEFWTQKFSHWTLTHSSFPLTTSTLHGNLLTGMLITYPTYYGANCLIPQPADMEVFPRFGFGDYHIVVCAPPSSDSGHLPTRDSFPQSPCTQSNHCLAGINYVQWEYYQCMWKTSLWAHSSPLSPGLLLCDMLSRRILSRTPMACSGMSLILPNLCSSTRRSSRCRLLCCFIGESGK